MKKRFALVLMAIAIMSFGIINVFALDYDVPEGAISITARFFVDEDTDANEFSMTSEDGETVIYITDETLIYFEDFVPVDDETDEMTQMVRDVLFGRTLAEVLNGRNMVVTLETAESTEPISIRILFEIAVTGPEPIDGLDLVTIVGTDLTETDVDTEDAEIVEYADDLDWLFINGEIVVNNELLENAPMPFITDDGIVMVPLRAIAEALGFSVNWDETMQSIRLGVAIHTWIGRTEAHVGRMAPIELSAAPVIANDITFVPIDFIRNVLSQNVYTFEGQVVIGAESDMN